MSENVIRGKAFVVGDNIDTDQIIPAQYLNLVPTIPEEYRKLGSHALCGLPVESNPERFVAPGQEGSVYRIIVGGRNFGCGSSREHAPISLGASGAKAVVAESFARIFFRNCVATGEIYPVESEAPLAAHFKTGDEAELDVEAGVLRNARSGESFKIKPLGDVKEVVEAGGIFAYARSKGMISS